MVENKGRRDGPPELVLEPVLQLERGYRIHAKIKEAAVCLQRTGRLEPQDADHLLTHVIDKDVEPRAPARSPEALQEFRRDRPTSILFHMAVVTRAALEKRGTAQRRFPLDEAPPVDTEHSNVRHSLRDEPFQGLQTVLRIDLLDPAERKAGVGLLPILCGGMADPGPWAPADAERGKAQGAPITCEPVEKGVGSNIVRLSMSRHDGRTG